MEFSRIRGKIQGVKSQHKSQYYWNWLLNLQCERISMMALKPPRWLPEVRKHLVAPCLIFKQLSTKLLFHSVASTQCIVGHPNLYLQDLARVHHNTLTDSFKVQDEKGYCSKEQCPAVRKNGCFRSSVNTLSFLKAIVLTAKFFLSRNLWAPTLCKESYLCWVLAKCCKTVHLFCFRYWKWMQNNE